MTAPTDTRYARISLAAHLFGLALLCLLVYLSLVQPLQLRNQRAEAQVSAQPVQAEPAPQPPRPRAPRVALPAPVRAPEPLAAVPDPAPLAMTPVTRSAIDAYRASIRPAQPLENPQ